MGLKTLEGNYYLLFYRQLFALRFNFWQRVARYFSC